MSADGTYRQPTRSLTLSIYDDGTAHLQVADEGRGVAYWLVGGDGTSALEGLPSQADAQLFVATAADAITRLSIQSARAALIARRGELEAERAQLQQRMSELHSTIQSLPWEIVR